MPCNGNVSNFHHKPYSFHRREKASCGKGSCIQMYRHHWMLVWDDSLPHFPPVKFVPVELPSHCECVNIGS